jgi:hypothetical protein
LGEILIPLTDTVKGFWAVHTNQFVWQVSPIQAALKKNTVTGITWLLLRKIKEAISENLKSRECFLKILLIIKVFLITAGDSKEQPQQY